MSFMGRSVSSFDDAPPAVDLNSSDNRKSGDTNVSNRLHIYTGMLPQKAVILQMQDFNELENKVANALIKAIPKCDVSTIKIFELIVSAINPKDPPADQVVHVEKEMLYEFLDLNGTKRAVNLKSKVKKFSQQLLFDFSSLSDDERDSVNQIISRDEPDMIPLHKEHLVTAAIEIFWEPRGSYIAFKMTKRIMFFLSYLGRGKDGELNGKDFTRYDLVGMNKFESKYSVILYRWLRMKHQSFKYNFKEKGVKNKIDLSVKELRELTDTTNLYDRFTNFEYRVLQVPQNEINEFSTIKFEYRKIKKGRNVVAIQFFVSDNPKNIPVKEETLTPRKTKEEREADTMASAYKALVNEYTEKLEKRWILKKDYKKDMKMLARLNDDLYPLYDQIVADKGIEILDIHLDMIQKRVENAKTYIQDPAAYLITIANQSIEKNFIDEYKYKANRHNHN